MLHDFDGGSEAAAHSGKNICTTALKAALEQRGCPLCRIESETESRFVFSLLWEYVNDPHTRENIVRSLGFCGRHTWRIFRTERTLIGTLLGNGILAAHLTSVTEKLLRGVQERLESGANAAGERSKLLRSSTAKKGGLAAALKPEADCIVCEECGRSGRFAAGTLLQVLSHAEDGGFRNLYARSDRLCMRHLRLALETGEPDVEAGLAFLVGDAIEYVSGLNRDLRSYIDKQDWNMRESPLSGEEADACRRAAGFFGGGEPSGDT